MNWVKEREELVESEAYIQQEYEAAKVAMHDWEVLAMEERTIRQDLADRVADLEEQLNSVRDAYEKARDERDTQSNTVDGLQKALQEIQTVRKTELKELVEKSESELEALRKQLQESDTLAEGRRTELESARKELDRALPFEKEVKEKNLLIGKLRHEAVILNDHLTKALRFLKKGKPEDNVDRYVLFPLDLSPCGMVMLISPLDANVSAQSYCHQPFPAIPCKGPVRPQEISGVATDRSPSGMDGRTERTSWAGALWQ
jgi:chromosome segregation ATPase